MPRGHEHDPIYSLSIYVRFSGQCLFKVTRPSFFGGLPSYFEALWYPHLYFYRTSNT